MVVVGEVVRLGVVVEVEDVPGRGPNRAGFDWFGGLGWEYQVTRTFAASAMLSYNRVDIGGSAFDSAQFVPLVASLNWNF